MPRSSGYDEMHLLLGGVDYGYALTVTPGPKPGPTYLDHESDEEAVAFPLNRPPWDVDSPKVLERKPCDP